MHSIYSLESGKMKTTNARLLRDQMAFEKNKKMLWPKSVSLEVVQKKSASQHKKGRLSQKGLSIFFFKSFLAHNFFLVQFCTEVSLHFLILRKILRLLIPNKSLL